MPQQRWLGSSSSVEECGEPRCTAEAGDDAAYIRTHRAKCQSQPKLGYDVLLLDAFTSDGLASSTQRQSTLEDAAGCLTARGLLLVNLHTGPRDDPDDQDYYVARRVLRALCAKFDSVYSLLCGSTQNLIAICHNGDLVEAGDWEGRIEALMSRADVRGACVGFSLTATMGRFDFVGGKAHPMADEPGVGDLPS